MYIQRLTHCFLSQTLAAAKAADPFAALDTALTNMATAVTDMKTVKLPAVKTKVTALNDIYYYNTSRCALGHPCLLCLDPPLPCTHA